MKQNIEYKSSHGGCPILLGSKWIFNKWIYYFDQWKNYPCVLNPDNPISNYHLPFKGAYEN